MLSHTVHRLPTQAQDRPLLSPLAAAPNGHVGFFLAAPEIKLQGSQPFPPDPTSLSCSLGILTSPRSVPPNSRLQFLPLHLRPALSSSVLLHPAPQYQGWLLSSTPRDSLSLYLFGYPSFEAYPDPDEARAAAFDPSWRTLDSWLISRSTYTFFEEKRPLQLLCQPEQVSLVFLQFPEDEIADATLFLLQWLPAQPHRPP